MPDEVEILGASLDETVVEELIPAAQRRPKRERGDRPLLEVKGLRTSFYTRDGVVRAVDGIDFHVDRGEIMGLVGESGCGKSVTSLSIMRLIAKPGRIEAGEILFDGENLLKLRDDKMREHPGQPDLDDLPAADVVAQPGVERGAPGRGGPAHPPRDEGRRGPGPRAGAAPDGRHPRPGATTQGLSRTRCRAGWPSGS